MNNESGGEKPRETQDELPWPDESTEKAYEETNASMDQLSEKLQEPDPEGPQEVVSGISWMKAHYAKLDEQMRQSKKSLIDICAILFEAGITRVEVTYDGYGDSGGIESVAFLKGKKLLKSKEVDSLELPTSTSKQYVHDPGSGEYQCKDVECTIEARVEECAYDFFPGGWEINEGSFGDLVINTEKAKATLKHNTRVESTEYSEARYDLTSEEGLDRPPWISDTL